MAETRFIKTVTFGGYDKGDVDKRFDYLYSQYYENKNELRETKLMLSKLRDGSDEAAAHDSVIAGERAKLTEFQVKNEQLSEKLKSAEEDNKAKEKEIADLKARLEETEKALSDATTQLTAVQGGGDAAMLGVVFAEAQKSANMILSTAKQQASDLETDSKKLAENTVTEANNKAAKIIYEAEKYAAQVTADADNKSAQMDAASGNLKAAMLDEVTKIGEEVSKLKAVLVDFEKNGISKIEESEKLIKDTKADLTAGGVPVFTTPEVHEAKIPDAPELTPVDNTYATGTDELTKKKNEDLEKLKAMAKSIDSSKGDTKKEEKADKGGVDLASLAKQAASLGGDKKSDANKSEKKAEQPKKKSGGDLSDLLKQAKSIK
ncbi:MAG: plectin [Ruminococcus sp.]|nr:plectin [Ruminococcus sp.]